MIPIIELIPLSPDSVKSGITAPVVEYPLLEVQKFYREFIHPELSLVDFVNGLTAFGVKARDYPEHKMWLLDYDQIEAVKNNPIVNECRGLIMGYDGKIICKSFNRFYNLGENGVDTFDFENSTAFEKADGSLVRMYWCPSTNRWEIATRGTAFAEGPHPLHGTFRNAILKAMGVTEEKFQSDASQFDKYTTRVYEYISPDNRIVTPYKESQLVALSYVSVLTFKEVVAPGAAIERGKCGWNVRCINAYKFGTQAECLETLKNLPNLEEGYVVYNHNTGERVKIKSPAYVAAHRIRGNGLTINSICELVAMNEYEEYLAVFPEDAQHFQRPIELYEIMLSRLVAQYVAHKDKVDQKEFALAVKDFPLSCVMFKARKTGNTATHEFNQFPVNKRAEWLKEAILNERKNDEDTLA